MKRKNNGGKPNPSLVILLPTWEDVYEWAKHRSRACAQETLVLPLRDKKWLAVTMVTGLRGRP